MTGAGLPFTKPNGMMVKKFADCPREMDFNSKIWKKNTEPPDPKNRRAPLMGKFSHNIDCEALKKWRQKVCFDWILKDMSGLVIKLRCWKTAFSLAKNLELIEMCYWIISIIHSWIHWWLSHVICNPSFGIQKGTFNRLLRIPTGNITADDKCVFILTKFGS